MRTFPGSGQDISGRLKMGQKYFYRGNKTEKMVVISFCMVLFENTAETVYSRPEKKM